MNPMDTQIGGNHYKKLRIQPMEYSMANNLDPCQHSVVKYITRFRDKGGIADLEKAIHVIEMLIEFERQAESPASSHAPTVEKTASACRHTYIQDGVQNDTWICMHCGEQDAGR